MRACKWNFTTHEYEDYVLPDGAVAYCNDMAYMIVCAECGREVMYGDCYTSRRIYTPFGMGYAVCWDCHEKEIKAEVAAGEELLEWYYQNPFEEVET